MSGRGRRQSRCDAARLSSSDALESFSGFGCYRWAIIAFAYRSKRRSVFRAPNRERPNGAPEQRSSGSVICGHPANPCENRVLLGGRDRARLHPGGHLPAGSGVGKRPQGLPAQPAPGYPTAAGARLLEHARGPILLRLDAARADVTRMTPGTVGHPRRRRNPARRWLASAGGRTLRAPSATAEARGHGRRGHSPAGAHRDRPGGP